MELRMARSIGLIFAALISTTANAEEAAFPGPLAPLIGYCWTANFPDGKTFDTHCFRLVNNGRTVEDRHVVSGGKTPYSGIATYHFKPDTKQVGFTYVASDGGTSTGHLESQAGGFVVPQDRYVGSDGKAMTMRSVATFEGTAGYRMQTLLADKGASRPMFDQRFVRARPAPSQTAVVAGHLTVSRAIIPAVEPVGVDVAAYVAIDNSGEGDRLLSIDCTCAETVELHTIVGEGAARRMEKSWPLELPGGSRVEIRPGSSRHLMVMRSKQSVRLGVPIVTTLHFERAGAVQVEFQAVADSAAGW
jgi:copper(I)-binding protein